VATEREREKNRERERVGREWKKRRDAQNRGSF
jgi:hypothetical protein